MGKKPLLLGMKTVTVLSSSSIRENFKGEVQEQGSKEGAAQLWNIWPSHHYT